MVFERPNRIVDVGETTFGSSVQTVTFAPIGDRTLVQLHTEGTRTRDIGIITSVVERARVRRALRRVLGTLDRLVQPTLRPNRLSAMKRGARVC